MKKRESLTPNDKLCHFFSPVNFTTKCFGDLGCFYTGPPWYHPLYRPISVPPQELQTKFLLYTRSNKEEPYYLEPTLESLLKSPFKDNLPIKVLAHGLGAHPDKFIGTMQELLKYSSYNVILVDWSREASGTPPQATANTRLVGAYTAKLLLFIMEHTGLKPEDIHLIGHSLGGHLISYVGERINNLGRITGLDIAGPYYDNAPKEVRLDRSDAIFVDIIQTNRGRSFFEGASLDEMVGHAVFSPNGGNRQPGCHYTPTTRPRGCFAQTVGKLCSHRKSIEYFQSSINTCRYTSYACIAYQAFREDACNHTPFTNRMGFHAVKPPYQLNYFLDTTGKAPYCEAK
ncbi:pancreatic lipase-related protein 2-like [Parasteatoda tepidariorum]|uniref:pancreatic lipase-related protein 2-like n=1 Tax=Parasteatoda tepidariorum TaxID=114398 RepID=UPI001C7201CA|nr:pancreatic lipase-related protein 2-like [Parasteatoda tepidariorum]XP_042907272.1 pancreatic lipase-related protein 2-like [Parasteatoda tepidariorum]